MLLFDFWCNFDCQKFYQHDVDKIMHNLLISIFCRIAGQKSMRKCAMIFERAEKIQLLGKVPFDTHNVRKYNKETRAYIAI